jgi:hypothetical protein
MKMKKIFRGIGIALGLCVVCTLLLYITVLSYRHPSNDRDWSVDQAILPEIIFEKDNKITIKNIRNFKYRATDVYTPVYYDRTIHVNDVQKVSYVIELLGTQGIAHTFLSFGLKDGTYIAVSAEARKEKGESFSPLKGLVDAYELTYIIADERDAVKLRTNYRKDPVYVFPTTISPENAQKLFLDMMERAHKLETQPESYNSLTNTCETNIVSHLNKVLGISIPWSYKIMLPARSDEVMQSYGLVETEESIESLRNKYHINDRALKYAGDPAFSQRIRDLK